MAEQQQIFRKVSLDRLSSPEQLDMMMRVTSTRSWVALLALCTLVVLAIGWSIFGSIPSKVGGTCMLIRPGGVLEVVAPGAGRITDISVDVGDPVREGQMIARIERHEAQSQIRSTEAKLHELRTQEVNLKKINAMTEEQLGAYLVDAERNLNNRIATGEERLSALAAKLQSQNTLLDQGLITKQTWLATRLEYATVRQDIDNYRNDIRQLGVRRLDMRKQIQTELNAIAIQINETSRKLANDMRNTDQLSLVFSPYNGRVIEINKNENTMVTSGAPILTIEQVGDSVTDLEARIFVAPLDGKKVKTNMDVQIATSTVKREEYGVMLGKVKSVADFPSSTEGMMRIFHNQQLVQALAAGAAPIAIQADLIPSANTASGYKWSSPRGPDTKIESGTLCTATITVRQQRPISLVIPVLRESLGL
jgi:HlyD family secretion protein